MPSENDTGKKIFPALRAGGLILLFTICSAVILKMFFIDAVVIPTRSMENTLLVGDYVFVNKLVHHLPADREDVISEAKFSSWHLPFIRPIERGDVIVFKFPGVDPASNNNPQYYVKRCVAQSGDEVAIVKGEVVVNKTPSYGEKGTHSWSREDARILVPGKGDCLTLDHDNFGIWSTLVRNEGHLIEEDPGKGITIDGKPAAQYIVQSNYLFVLGDNRDHSYDSRAWGFLPEENVIGKAMIVYWSVEQSSASRGLSGFFSSIRWDRVGKFVQ